MAQAFYNDQLDVRCVLPQRAPAFRYSEDSRGFKAGATLRASIASRLR